MKNRRVLGFAVGVLPLGSSCRPLLVRTANLPLLRSSFRARMQTRWGRDAKPHCNWLQAAAGSGSPLAAPGILAATGRRDSRFSTR